MTMKLQKHTTIDETAQDKPGLAFLELRHQPVSITLNKSRVQSPVGEIATIGKTHLVEGPFKNIPPLNHQ